MGSSTILDIITSVVISGFLLLTALRLNDQANETNILYNSNLTLQQNMTAVTGILEHDFRRIGYCSDYKKIPDPAEAIRYADSSAIRFWLDIDNNGSVDSLEYYVGPTSEMSSTINPRDRVLYRKVNNQTPQRLEMGVTEFRFKFFNALGDTLLFPISNPREIHSMEIAVQIESFAPFAVRYTASNDTLADFQMYWRQIRLAARNLRNR
jgi:type II secretory pathway component PulJ